jgi:hypothetical protein
MPPARLLAFGWIKRIAALPHRRSAGDAKKTSPDGFSVGRVARKEGKAAGEK